MMMTILMVWLVGIPVWVIVCGFFGDEDLAQYCPFWPIPLVMIVLQWAYSFLYRIGRGL